MADIRRYISWETGLSSEKHEHQVTLYTKTGCHLCENAYEVLMGVREDWPFVFETIDITTDEILMEIYGELIPVVLIDGEERFRYRVNEKRLRRELSK